MNGTVLPAWVHSVAFLAMSLYLFILWRGLVRGDLREAQQRFVDRVGVLRSKSATLIMACLFLMLAVGNAAWAFGYQW